MVVIIWKAHFSLNAPAEIRQAEGMITLRKVHT